MVVCLRPIQLLDWVILMYLDFVFRWYIELVLQIRLLSMLAPQQIFRDGSAGSEIEWEFGRDSGSLSFSLHIVSESHWTCNASICVASGVVSRSMGIMVV
jgi:hypothetical protein